jgi:hypothetical protein
MSFTILRVDFKTRFDRYFTQDGPDCRDSSCLFLRINAPFILLVSAVKV